MERIKNYTKLKYECIQWLRKWFEENGKGCNAVIGISGGKDSTVVAKLCVEALGKDRVIGVLMPNGEQKDIDDSINICKLFDIKYYIIDIEAAYNSLIKQVGDFVHFVDKSGEVSLQTKQNLPPRLRMSTLYAVSQSFNGRVVGTSNASENYIGYCTAWGDQVSDVEPIANLTVTEVKKLGHALGIPSQFVEKTPADGLPESCPDEEKFGFSYATLDDFICDNVENIPDDVKEKINGMHTRNLFKINRVMIDTFMPEDVFEWQFGPLDSYQDFLDEIEAHDWLNDSQENGGF